MKDLLKKEGFLILFTIALIATSGSLYFSEVRGFIPCTLCWYQRILMYPLVIVSMYSYLTKAKVNYLLINIVSGLGLLIALYHYGMQKLPSLQELGGSCGAVSCTGQYINWFGFITIPFLSFVAFTMLFVISFIILRINKKDSQS